MPVYSQQGSTKSKSSRDVPRSLQPEILDKRPALDEQALLNEQVAVNTFLNNNSINADNYHDNLSLVAGYPEGMVVLVTYYSQCRPVTDIQSNTVDLQKSTLDDVHLEYSEIRNFELRCENNAFAMQYDEEENITKVAGEAIILPGFIPKIADIFLYTMRNGKVGVFNVSSIQRLALGQETYHKIAFTLQEYLTTGRRDQLHRRSTVWYFDKRKFMVGNHAMLSSENYKIQKDLEYIRKEIIQDYISCFDDPSMGSFMRPDGIYDPYIVEYWNKMVSINDCNYRPTQLLISMRNFHKTIWSTLTNNPIKELRYLARDAYNLTFGDHFWGPNMTSLMGKVYLSIGDEPTNAATNGGGSVGSSSSSCCGSRYKNTFYDASRTQFIDAFLGLVQETFDKPQVYSPDPFYLDMSARIHNVYSTCCTGTDCCCSEDDLMGTELYGLSTAFYLGSTTMDAFERVLYDMIHKREVSPKIVYDLVYGYLDWEESTKFYRHLFALYMIRTTLYWLRNHS